MAELDPERAQRLCSPLARAMGRELGRPVVCRDVTGQQRRWDFVVVDQQTRRVSRRISHVTSTVEEMARASAEVVDDVWPAVESALAAEGVRDVWVGLHTRDLPRSRAARQRWARRLAEHIRKMVDQALVANPTLSVPVSVADDDVEFFDCATVHPAPRPGPAKVLAASDGRLTRFVPDLHDRIMPTIAKKQAKHGESARRLTLLVEVVDGGWSQNELRRGRRRIARAGCPFRSIYLARLKRRSYRMVRYL